MSAGRLLVLVIAVASLSFGAWLYYYLTTHGLGARGAQPSAFEFLALQGKLATPASVKGLENPLPATPLNIAEARDHFADHCAICHANDGSGRTMINAGLYPAAPDMREARTQELSDGELFVIIRDGIRFTGMPGWGGEDHENWQLVLFIRHLPQITAEELELMKEINNEAY